jgi:hypothetical protein
MDTRELRERAATEAAELGPIPTDVREREICAMERRGAVVQLAGLADWDATLLKRAALGVASEWTNRSASKLLMDAAQECGHR